jgi:Mg2+ and Co2+ transporter CorA
MYNDGMKRLLLLCVVAGMAFGQDAAAPAGAKKITDANELEDLLKKESNTFFLDVRDPKEIEELGTLKGYVNIPLPELEKRMGEVPKDKTIITA